MARMRAVLLALVVCLAALSFAPSAEAHTIVCRADDTRCIIQCLAHVARDPNGDHACAIDLHA